jgi:cardiolipin synthase
LAAHFRPRRVDREAHAGLMAAPRSRWPKLFVRGLDLVPGNRLRLFQGCAEFFPALVAAIDAAHSEIHLQTYIFYADTSTREIRDALIRAAQRGVQVRVLIDGVGSRELPLDWLRILREAGVRVLAYRPPVLGWHANPRSLRRMHRKLAVIDARVAFIGGINLIDDFEPIRFDGPRFDFMVEVQGPLLVPIYRSARRLWRVVALSRRPGRERNDAPIPLEPSWPTDGHVRAAFIVRDNFAHRSDIERSYLTALALARSEVFIANAYFLPGNRFRRLLKKAVARGVRVQLLVQGRTDHAFFQAAARALYQDLLSAGVRIYEYQASELHAKAAVVDGHWATIGSSNIDPFSLLLAREANLVVDDAGFAQDLGQRLHAALADAVPLDLTDWQARPWLQRQLSRLAYAVVRALLGVAGMLRWV